MQFLKLNHLDKKIFYAYKHQALPHLCSITSDAKNCVKFASSLTNLTCVRLRNTMFCQKTAKDNRNEYSSSFLYLSYVMKAEVVHFPAKTNVKTTIYFGGLFAL